MSTTSTVATSCIIIGRACVNLSPDGKIADTASAAVAISLWDALESADAHARRCGILDKGDSLYPADRLALRDAMDGSRAFTVTDPKSGASVTPDAVVNGRATKSQRASACRAAL